MIISLAQHLAECRLTCDDPRVTEDHFPLVGEPADLSKMLVVPQRRLGFTTRAIKQSIVAKHRPVTLLELFRWRRSNLDRNEPAFVALGTEWDSGDPVCCRLVPFIHGGKLQLVCSDDYGKYGETSWPDYDPHWDFYSFLLVPLDQ